MFGIDTNQRFFKTIESIEKSGVSFDCIFLTGDISQDKTKLSYEIIAQALTNFNKKVYWIPVNHDHFSNMQQVFSKYQLFEFTSYLFLDHINWRFLFIDTVAIGKDSGYITQDSLTVLAKHLSFAITTPTAIVTHHHPIDIGTPLIDQFMLKNSDDLLAVILATHAHIKVMICGHVHGSYDIVKKNMRLISSPATCLQ